MSERIDVFIPSSPKDYPVLEYSIKSVIEYFKECNDVIVSVPDKSKLHLHDYECNGHKIIFMNDLELFSVLDL